MTNIYQNPLFSKLVLLSFGEIVNLKNFLLVLNFLNNEVSEALQELLKNTNNQNYYNARAVNHPLRTSVNKVQIFQSLE